jgi:hypothetical protein
VTDRIRRRRRVAAAWLALLGTAVAAGPLAGGALGARRPPSPAHLLVDAQEWSLWPSSTSLPAGTVDVELWNRGEDAHDLRIRRLNGRGQMTGKILGAVKSTPSGGIRDAVWHLRPGRYELYCAMPGHLQMGMHVVITLRPR